MRGPESTAGTAPVLSRYRGVSAQAAGVLLCVILIELGIHFRLGPREAAKYESVAGQNPEQEAPINGAPLSNQWSQWNHHVVPRSVPSPVSAPAAITRVSPAPSPAAKAGTRGKPRQRPQATAHASRLPMPPTARKANPRDSSQPCLHVQGPLPPLAPALAPNVTTTRIILLAPHTAALPSVVEVAHWLRPGWYTLLVEHPDFPWSDAYADDVALLTDAEGVSAAVENSAGHRYAPATFAVLRAAAQTCLLSRGIAGPAFAQAHDVETVVYVRHWDGRLLEDPFPRYFLPHQRLPVLNVGLFLDWPTPPAPLSGGIGADERAAELLLQHFVRDAARSDIAVHPNALRLCTRPARAVIQYGLCQPSDAAAPDVFLLEEAPPVVARPVHPAWTSAAQRNTAAHRQAFWALALLTVAEDRAATDAAEAEMLQRVVHCALARLRFDVATLPPGAICGDPPGEVALAAAAAAAPPVSQPDHDYALQVNWARLTASPFFGFNPSRAHGPRPRAAVSLDATPTIDREHMFAPHEALSANASLLSAALLSCLPAAASSAWLLNTIAMVLRDFEVAAPLLLEAAEAEQALSSRQGGRALLESGGPPSLRKFTFYSRDESLSSISTDCPYTLDLLDEEELAACREACITDKACNGVYFSVAKATCLARRCIDSATVEAPPAAAADDSKPLTSTAPSANAPVPASVDGLAAPTLPPLPGNASAFVLVGGVDEAAWSDDCSHIMQVGGMGLEGCKEACFVDPDCNAFNYNAKNRDCIYRQCNDPLTPRLTIDASYLGYRFFGLPPGNKFPTPSPLPVSQELRGSIQATCAARLALLHDIDAREAEEACAIAASSTPPTRRPRGFEIALPTELQLDERCLVNCFDSSQRRRDIVLSQGYQHYTHRFTRGSSERIPAHMPFLLFSSLPALSEYYGDFFVALNYYAYGPRVPELNLENCVSDDPGGTSGHVVQRCVAMGLAESFGHLFMVWAADDCLVNPFNLVSRDLRRVHTRMPWVWNERAYSEDNGDDSIMGRSIRGVKFAQDTGLAFPEEVALHATCMRRSAPYDPGNVSNAYVDSFALPRSVFGRIAALSKPFTDHAVYLEVALPTAMCMTSWNDDRIPQRCSYVYGPSATALEVIDRWSPALDWQHPWKLGNNPHLRRFMREMKANYTARPEEYDDYNLRTSLGVDAFSCG